MICKMFGASQMSVVKNLSRKLMVIMIAESGALTDQHFLNFMAKSCVGSHHTVGATTDNPGSTPDYIFL